MSDLKLYIKCDEILSNSARDLSGNNRDGTVSGNVSKVADAARGHCFHFDGSGDYLTLDTAPNLGLSYGSFTVEGWIKCANFSSGWHTLMGTGTRVISAGLHLLFKHGKPHLGFVGNDTTSNTVLSDNVWYHVAFRYDKDKGEQAIFINGALDIADTGLGP